MRFLLGAPDRARYGLPDEPIYVDMDRLTNREADLIEAPEPAGPGLTPKHWFEALHGEPVEDERGVPVINDATGKQRRRLTRHTIAILIWLGMRRAGFTVAWPDLEYDILTVDLEPDTGETDEDEDEGAGGEGKEPGPPPTPSSGGS